MKKCKLLYFVSEDEYFLSHKLSHAIKALENNFEVTVLTKYSNYERKIKSLGFKTANIDLDRKSINPIKELICFFHFCKTIFRIKPDIIQCIALKPILYTSIISRFINKEVKMIFCVVGLGYLFLNKKFVTIFVKKIYFILLKLFLSNKNSIFIFQNQDDLSFFFKQKILKNLPYEIIRGSGVDIKKFKKKKIKKIYDIIIHSRLLMDKGIMELVNAILLLKEKKKIPKLLILGNPDKRNRATIEKNQILYWKSKKILTWKGKVSNVVPYIQKSRISILPSYREGFPKSLLESASCGLPIITTDVPGCREICIHNFNGFLVPPKDSKSISKAIEKLLGNQALIDKFGKNSRKLVENNFSDKIISENFLKLYKKSF